MTGFDYSKWDKIELSDDEDDLHPNIDKDSWFRLKHRQRVEREEDEDTKRTDLERKLKKLQDELRGFGDAGKEHLKARKLQEEADKITKELEKIERERKWNADNMCKTAEDRSVVSETRGPAPRPEPRLQGEDLAKGYCEFVEEHEELLETFIALGGEDLEAVQEFLKEHGGTLLQGEHAESYLLLDCLEKEMNGQHDEMLCSARQNQLLTQLREFSRASGRPARDAVHPIFQRLLDHEPTRESFDEAVANFATRVERRAVVKKKEMDAEVEEAEASESKSLNPLGPGGLDPLEVLGTLPEEMQIAFREKDIQRLQDAIQALSDEDTRYHMRRCEESGLWVPNPAEGVPAYRQ